MRMRHRIELSGAYQSGYQVESFPLTNLPIYTLQDLQAAVSV